MTPEREVKLVGRSDSVRTLWSTEIPWVIVNVKRGRRVDRLVFTDREDEGSIKNSTVTEIKSDFLIFLELTSTKVRVEQGKYFHIMT